MAGLVPAIHASATAKKGVDARHKAGHDTNKTGLAPHHEDARSYSFTTMRPTMLGWKRQ
jgi:hypothetical protein